MEKVKAVMSWLLKSGKEAPAEAQSRGFVPGGTARDNTVSILVALLDGPDGRTATVRLVDNLSRITGGHVKQLNRSLSPARGKSDIEGLIAAAKKGRDWLTNEQCDILVWGGIDRGGTALTLRFLPLNSAPEGRSGAVGLGDELNLPLGYSTEIDDVIAAATLCASSSTQVGTRQDHVARLHEFALRVEPLGSIDIPGLDPVQLVTVLQMIANVMTTDSRGGGGQDTLERALAIYLRAIRLIPSDLLDGPRQALLHSQFAAALQAMAAKNGKPEMLEQAVESYKTAIAALSRNTHPHDWALSQIRLGLATYHLAGKTEQPKLIAKSIAALEQSLTIFTRTTNPGRWAEVKNHIGVVMTSMGEELSDNTMLEKAIMAFDDSLDVRKREQVVVLWAQTTNNLGAAAFALAKRTEDMALMQQAVYAFEGAIGVYRQIGQESRAHIIEKNMRRANQYLGGR